MPVHHLLSVHSYPLHPPHLPYFPTRRSSDLDSGRRRAGERLDRLRRRIRPFMLRRSKELVASDLPEKQEQVVRVPLEPAHRRLYDRILQRERQKLLRLVEDMDSNRFVVFRSLTLLRGCWRWTPRSWPRSTVRCRPRSCGPSWRAWRKWWPISIA